MRKTYFFRHGNAAKAKGGADDQSRPLTRDGARQCARLDLRLGQISFGLVLSSPAQRAISTALLVTTADERDIRIVDALYPDPYADRLGAEMDRLFNLPHLGYSPVIDYLNEDGGDAVMQWASRSWRACFDTIQDTGNPDVVAIFGHAVCQQAIAMAQCAGKRELVERIARINLAECGGFIVVSDAHGIPSSIEVIPD